MDLGPAKREESDDRPGRTHDPPTPRSGPVRMDAGPADAEERMTISDGRTARQHGGTDERVG